MRNSELMRRRANVSTLDLGRIKSDLEAIGEISQEWKKMAIHSQTACIIFSRPPPSSKMTYLCTRSLCCRVRITHIHTYIILKQVAHTHMHVQLHVWSVSLWLCLLCTLYGLLWTQQGSVSTVEFVRRTDRVPLMSVLLLFNITTEHTWNSRHGAAPFDM